VRVPLGDRIEAALFTLVVLVAVLFILRHSPLAPYADQYL